LAPLCKVAFPLYRLHFYQTIATAQELSWQAKSCTWLGCLEYMWPAQHKPGTPAF